MCVARVLVQQLQCTAAAAAAHCSSSCSIMQQQLQHIAYAAERPMYVLCAAAACRWTCRRTPRSQPSIGRCEAPPSATAATAVRSCTSAKLQCTGTAGAHSHISCIAAPPCCCCCPASPLTCARAGQTGDDAQHAHGRQCHARIRRARAGARRCGAAAAAARRRPAWHLCAQDHP